MSLAHSPGLRGRTLRSFLLLGAQRIVAVAESLYLSAETDLGQALGQVEKIVPRPLIVDSVLMLQFGEKIAEGPPGEVMARPDVVEAYLGAEVT